MRKIVKILRESIHKEDMTGTFIQICAAFRLFQGKRKDLNFWFFVVEANKNQTKLLLPSNIS